MSNMFNVLYNRYIDQIKLQEIQNYNEKHRDYLIRAGKISISNPEQHVKNDKKQYHGDQRSIKPLNNNGEQRQNITFHKNKNIKEREFPADQNQNYYQQKDQRSQLQSMKQVGKDNYQSYSKQPSNFKPKQSQNSYPYEDEQNYNYPKNQPIQRPSEERSIKPNLQSQNSNQQFSQFPEQQEDVVLEQCPQGCGRKFKESALEKHIKICQKVFQKKRKPFKVDVVDDEAKKLAGKTSNGESKKPKVEKVPKWKKQSQMLRKGLKSNQQGGSSQSLPVEEEDDRTQCPSCSRKFNDQAAQRHIPHCLKRTKQRK